MFKCQILILSLQELSIFIEVHKHSTNQSTNKWEQLPHLIIWLRQVLCRHTTLGKQWEKQQK